MSTTSSTRPPLIAVCGAGEATIAEVEAAEEVGRLLAEGGATIVCGGLGGVMAAAAAGARRAGGISLGVLPGSDAGEGSANLTLALPTGLAEMRNTLIVRAARAVIAIGGGYGTLSEIAFALRLGKPVIAMRSWEIRRSGSDHADQGIRVAGSAQEAAEWALHEARRAQARG